jgi:hypothetical protein
MTAQFINFFDFSLIVVLVSGRSGILLVSAVPLPWK